MELITTYELQITNYGVSSAVTKLIGTFRLV